MEDCLVMVEIIEARKPWSEEETHKGVQHEQLPRRATMAGRAGGFPRGGGRLRLGVQL